MANAQIQQGGSAALPLTITGSGGGGAFTVLNPAGTQIATGTYQTANNGYNTTNFVTGTNPRTVTLSIPASAPIGTGYTLTFQNPDGTGATTSSFDVTAASGPIAPTAPTFNATTTGSNVLSVNTQALTSNATSEQINVYTDSNGTTPISGSPFAVPSPGSAVNVNLVSGTQYYVSLSMVGSNGTTKGPLAAVLFDTTGPVYSSVAINSTGNRLVTTYNDFSPPLQANGTIPTLTGLSGGATTLSNPVYAANTVTYTISRTVLTSETGGVFNAVAGAIKDSASPTNNQSGAVTNQTVVNNSGIVSVPASPTGVFVNSGNNQNTVGWVNAAGSISANIYRSATLNGTYSVLIAGVTITSPTFTDLTALNGNTYYYKVSNTNSGGEGPLSVSGVVGNPTASGGSSAPPSGLTATAVAGQGIQLAWTNPNGNIYTGINIYRISGTSVNGVFHRIDPVPGQPLQVVTSYLDKIGTGFASVTGSNQFSYAVCGIVNNVETVLSNIAGPVTFTG